MKGLCVIFCMFLMSLGAADEVKTEKECLKEKIVTTPHQVKINGKMVSYQATAGTLLMKDDKECPTASFFFVAYTKQDEKSIASRPITFCFNGGPGSSSVWLHLGVLGPQKLATDTFGNPEHPYHLEDNEFSILDLTDLVFIDPVSTGFTRAQSTEEAKKFHSVEEDIKSVAEFIRLYITRYERWTSPKFLMGESYGTTRAAGLANHLSNKLYIETAGILMLSSALDFGSFRTSWEGYPFGNDLPYMTFLPSYTMTAWYHKKLPQELQRDVEKARQVSESFALNEYNLALIKGTAIGPEEKEKVAQKLAELTGLSKEFILKSNLRVGQGAFAKQLLVDKGRVVGRFDSRVAGITLDPTAVEGSYDPSLELWIAPITAVLNNYLETKLNWKEDRPYEILNRSLIANWNFGSAADGYLNLNHDLLEVMTKKPGTRVFVGSGYYDLATPYFATQYTFSHLGLDPELKDHVTLKYYDAGHMMYFHKPSLVKLKKDFTEFYQSVLN